MYGYEYAVGAFDATYNKIFGMIATVWGLVLKVNVFASPSWFSYTTGFIVTTGSIVWVWRLLFMKVVSLKKSKK